LREYVEGCVDGSIKGVSEKIAAGHGLDARILARMLLFEFLA
jgi:hypothetical protein